MESPGGDEGGVEGLPLAERLSRLHLAGKAAVQLEAKTPDYVMDVASQTHSDEPLIASVFSNFSVSLMSSNLATNGRLIGHKNTITGVTFGKADENMVYTCSKDKTIRCWDTRICKETLTLKAPPSIKAVYLCLAVGASDRLLCAGTEREKDDAYLLFWDLRKNEVMGCYNECHQDDITQLAFREGSDQLLAAGSADGLVNTYDLAQADEDDALLTTANASSLLTRVCWCGGGEAVYGVTSDNMFYVWDAEEGEELIEVQSITELLGDNSPVEYLVDCLPSLTAPKTDRQSAVLVAGDHSGAVHLVRLDGGRGSVTASLTGGHSTTLRCSHWDHKRGRLVTGAEDALVCVWSPDPALTFDTEVKPQNKMRGKGSGGKQKPYTKGKKKK